MLPGIALPPRSSGRAEVQGSQSSGAGGKEHTDPISFPMGGYSLTGQKETEWGLQKNFEKPQLQNLSQAILTRCLELGAHGEQTHLGAVGSRAETGWKDRWPVAEPNAPGQLSKAALAQLTLTHCDAKARTKSH